MLTPLGSVAAIFLYALTDDPWVLVALQALDGIGAGIYGVVIAVICADLTRFGSQGLVAGVEKRERDRSGMAQPSPLPLTGELAGVHRPVVI